MNAGSAARKGTGQTSAVLNACGLHVNTGAATIPPTPATTTAVATRTKSLAKAITKTSLAGTANVLSTNVIATENATVLVLPPAVLPAPANSHALILAMTADLGSYGKGCASTAGKRGIYG